MTDLKEIIKLIEGLEPDKLQIIQSFIKGLTSK